MVIDTMVFAYALLQVEGKYEQSIAALESASQIIVPDSWFAELGNVVWQWIQFQQLPLQVGLDVLEDAAALVDRVVLTADVRATALELAVQNSHSFYDTVFVAAAIRENVSVLTFDRKFAAKFPEHVRLLN
jgi:predicted nucleic acid-binding protein